jgi:hypothetical protein
MLTVKPGMTGPWAVRSVPALGDEIRLTLYYIRNWVIWVDLQILYRTGTRILQWQRRRTAGLPASRSAGTGYGESPFASRGELPPYTATNIMTNPAMGGNEQSVERPREPTD